MSLSKTKLKQFNVELVTHWECPEDGGAPIIAMPNLPKPLHGQAPRTLLGNSTWNHMRNKCYYDAGYQCEICGAKVGVDIEKRNLHAHELYTIDYEKGESRFVRCIAACYLCHIGGIHTGRAITLYKQGNPIYTKEFLLDGAENAFKLIYEYNKKHPKNKLKAYSTFIEYLDVKELQKPMQKLIDKYEIEFYQEDEKRMAKWGDWSLWIGSREFPTPYANEKEWENAMEKNAKNDTERKIKTPLKGEVFDKLDELLQKPVEN